MLESSLMIMAQVQQVLDKGFQSCLDLGKRMQDEIETAYEGGLELLHNQPEQIKNFLSPWVNQFYEVLAQTIFEVLRVTQPEDFEGGKKVNLYLLPGYHSHLIGRRIFYQKADGDGDSYKDYGVGLCGDPLASPGEVESYHDCCHSRWYRHATMPPQTRDFLPASPYHWFGYQQPRISPEPYDLVASLTFTTVASAREDASFPNHRVLNLSDPAVSSREWGAMVAGMLNSMPHVTNPEWKFPDRKDKAASDMSPDPRREEQLRAARCLLISLWMHSVFKDTPPDWWDELNEELEKQQIPSMVAAIAEARGDGVACDWGDGSSGRPGFVTWTTIGLHPLIAPPPPPLYGTRDYPAHVQTAGWATLLCSVPLSLPFIAVVRQWIRMVYGMLRSAEVSVLLRNRGPLDRAAQMVRSLTHDIHKSIEESTNALYRDAEHNSKDAIDERRFSLMALLAQSTLSYAICSAAPDPAKRERLKRKILESLSVDDEVLYGVFWRVANDIQRYKTLENRAHVYVPISPPKDLHTTRETYTTCLLLTGEMVRNYCEHGPRGKMTELVIRRDERRLEITLEGQGCTSPGGESFALLHNVLETLELGEAHPERLGVDSYRWRVIVNYSGNGARA